MKREGDATRSRDELSDNGGVRVAEETKREQRAGTGVTHFNGLLFRARNTCEHRCDSFFAAMHEETLLCRVRAAVCAVTGKQNVIWIESMGVQTSPTNGEQFLSGNF